MKYLYLLLIGIISPLSASLCDYVNDDGYSRVYIGPNVNYTKLNISTASSPVAVALGLVSNVNLHGVLGGFTFGYERQKPCGVYANFELDWTLGKISGVHANDRFVHRQDWQARLGYTFPFCLCGQSFSFTPYTGVEMHYLTQRFSGIVLNVKYRSYYIPVGVILDYSFRDCWKIGFNAEWAPQIDSTVQISVLKGARWELVNRSILYFELPITRSFGCDGCWTISFVPYWECLKHGPSTAVTSQGTALGLPAQRWTFTGAKLTFGFVY